MYVMPIVLTVLIVATRNEKNEGARIEMLDFMQLAIGRCSIIARGNGR